MTQTNDLQRIVFQQGGPLDGDSGERGNDTLADGGVESVKPLNDGERAHQTVFRRPEENIRRRTEVLRDAGEQQKYLADQMRWAFTPGRNDGTAIGPVLDLAQIIWNSTTGIFSLTEDAVLQPLNTPETDMQETVDYPFDDGTTTTQISFNMVPGSASPGRAYNGANLVNIVWAAVPFVDLASALVPDYCDIVISGDPDHVLTITIRNDDQTAMSHVQTALAVLGVPALEAIGLQATIIPVVSTFLEYVDITTPDYVLEKNFDRELHYIPTTSWDDFFTSLGRGLNDGETVAIRWASYVDPSPGVTGRRQSIPSNVPDDSTLVLGSQLFSTTEHPEWIPFSIPVCKRVALDLWWLDGTVSYGTDPIPSNPIYMGEHGYTVERILTGGTSIPLTITEGWYTTDPPSWAAGATPDSAINGILDDLSQVTTGGGGAQEISKSPYPDPGGSFEAWSQEAVWLPAWESIGTWLETLLLEVNRCARLDSGGSEKIYLTWYFNNYLNYSASARDEDDPGSVGIYDPIDDVTWCKRATFYFDYDSGGNPDALITRAYVGRVREESGGGAHTYTFNRPIRGFQCGAVYTAPSEVTPNQLRIGGGDAYVRGRHVHLDEFILTNVWDGVAGKGGLTADTKTYLGTVTGSVICTPLYVWLRADGTVHIDIFGVDFSGNYGEVNDLHYKPAVESGLVGGDWEDWDYTLIDCVWLIQGNTGGTGDDAIRMAGYLPLGGHYFSMERAQYREAGGALRILVPVIHQATGSQAAGTLTLGTANSISGTREWRSPGVPCISNRGNFALVGEADMSTSDRVRMVASLGRTTGAEYASFMYNTGLTTVPYDLLASNSCIDGPVLVWETAGGTVQKHAAGPATVVRSVGGNPPQMETVYDIQYKAGAGSIDGDLTIVVYFLGFWWDKYAGPDVSNFLENV